MQIFYTVDFDSFYFFVIHIFFIRKKLRTQLQTAICRSVFCKQKPARCDFFELGTEFLYFVKSRDFKLIMYQLDNK